MPPLHCAEGRHAGQAQLLAWPQVPSLKVGPGPAAVCRLAELYVLAVLRQVRVQPYMLVLACQLGGCTPVGCPV